MQTNKQDMYFLKLLGWFTWTCSPNLLLHSCQPGFLPLTQILLALYTLEWHTKTNTDKSQSWGHIWFWLSLGANLRPSSHDYQCLRLTATHIHLHTCQVGGAQAGPRQLHALVQLFPCTMGTRDGLKLQTAQKPRLRKSICKTHFGQTTEVFTLQSRCTNVSRFRLCLILRKKKWSFQLKSSYIIGNAPENSDILSWFELQDCN